MAKKILFRFGSDIQPITRFGELDLLYRPCYFRGKELGYEDGNMFFEWPKNLVFPLKCPHEVIIPLKFIDSINSFEYDKIMNLIDIGIFYENSQSLYNVSNPERRNHSAFANYMNKYYIKHHIRPIYHVKKDNIKDKYILVHTRNSNRAITRNPKKSNYEYMIRLLRERYSEYKIYRWGEISLEDNNFNSLFDKYFEQFSDFNDFLRLMNNSTLFIGCSSGPIQHAYSFGLPIIELDIPKTVDYGFLKDNYIGLGNHYSKDFWKYGLDGIYGDTYDYYIDKKIYLKLFKGDEINPITVCEFMDKWLK